jgi:hypothetical protein
VKKKGTTYLDSLPKINNSIFLSDDFLTAVGDNNMKTTAQAKSVYVNMGISINPETITALVNQIALA